MKAGFPTGAEPGPGASTRAPGFQPPPVAELAPLFPNLEVLELLGHGGMGAVYKARQPALDRLVALKILPPQPASDIGFAGRFNREARALARLSHPNIVAVHEFGAAGGYHYFIMEYVEGGNLRELQQAGRFSPAEALKIIPQICEALQYAHEQGIVHRDIKPENVMLDKRGRVKVTDFGLAKITGINAESSRLTGARDVMGTPHYMAPEQIEKPQEVDHRADLYSLGVVFYEMLTGELPLGRFAPPSKKVEVDVRLDEVVLHSLEKEPARRYQHAAQIKSDVETIEAQKSSPRFGPNPGSLSTAVKAARWIARIFSILLLLFYGGALMVEGMSPMGTQPGSVQLNFVALGLLLAGLVVGFKREGTAAILIASGVLLWSAVAPVPRWNVFQTPLPLAALYGFCWWAGNGRKSWTLAASAAVLVFAFIAGRLFLPTNVHVTGYVRGADGIPISGAELYVMDSAPGKITMPAARTDDKGFYSVWIGWYSEGLPVEIKAPGYEVARVTFGERPTGKRRLLRNFILPRAAHEDTASVSDLLATPVVVTTFPASGTSDVDPQLRELRATFSLPMADQSWSWVTEYEQNTPEITGSPRFLSDQRTCVLPVNLQPNRVYALWINSQEHQNFLSNSGIPSLPYLLIFKTKD